MFYKMLKGTLCALGILLLILDTKTAIRGATEGISLCLRVLIPSLFPFFILSVLLTDTLIGTAPGFLHPLGKILRIPAGSESLLIIGLLSGYPNGAQTVRQSQEKGFLLPHDANRMIGFCSNAGPAFLFGMVAPQFPDSGYTWVLWEVLILSAILTGLLLPGGNNHSVNVPGKQSLTVSQALDRSIKIMAGVCGWAILFRVILEFLDRWFLWMLPQDLRVATNLVLELANGCLALNQIDNIVLRFILCAAGLSFGGLCVLMQTVSVTAPGGIGMYLPGKLLQTGISTLLAAMAGLMLINGVPFRVTAIILLVVGIFLILLSFFRKKQKNCSSNLIPVSV